MKPHNILVAQAVIIFLAAHWWFVLIVPSFSSSDGVMRVHFLDVGQGDAVFIELPNNQQVLVDAGRGISVLSELSELLPTHDREIDVVVMTHPDADHIGGFVSILERYDVHTIIHSFIESDTSVYAKVSELVHESAAAVHAIDEAYTFSIDGVRFDILWPLGRTVLERNAASVVLLITYGDMEILLTGDANTAVEDVLVTLFGDQMEDIEILKAGHHGSKTSTSAHLLAHTKPDVIVYSASANNRYGHPHTSVIERVHAYNLDNPRREIQEYRTSDGTISFCLTRSSFSECRR